MTWREGILRFRLCIRGRRFGHAGFLLSLQSHDDTEPPSLEAYLPLSISPALPSPSGIKEISVIGVRSPDSLRHQEITRLDISTSVLAACPWKTCLSLWVLFPQYSEGLDRTIPKVSPSL